MSDELAIQIVGWAIGLAGALIVFMIRLWWKIEMKQDHKIDSLGSVNGKEHRDLHDKIEANHNSIRDRLDNIWKHIKTPDD